MNPYHRSAVRPTRQRTVRAAVAAAVVVAAGALALGRGPAGVGAVALGQACSGVITGTVRTAAGVAVPRAEVRVVTVDGGTAVQVATGADGGYRAADLCAGTYHVAAAAATSAGQLRGVHDRDGDGAADDVPLTDAQPLATGIDVVVRPADPAERPTAAATGTPTPHPSSPPCAFDDGVIAGTVFGPDGRPVDGAYVVAHPSRRPASTVGGGGVLSGPDGRYRLAGRCDGDHTVTAGLRLNSGPLAGAYDPDGDGRPDVVTLRDAQRTATGIDIHLRPEPAAPAATATPTPAAWATPPRQPTPPPAGGSPTALCPDGQGVIAGAVRAADGSAVPGARVMAMARPMTNAQLPFTFVALTDAAGAYRLAGVCDAPYVVVALAVDAAGVRSGQHDPDGDGQPNDIAVSAAQRTHLGIDVVLGVLVGGPPQPRALPPYEPPPAR